MDQKHYLKIKDVSSSSLDDPEIVLLTEDNHQLNIRTDSVRGLVPLQTHQDYSQGEDGDRKYDRYLLFYLQSNSSQEKKQEQNDGAESQESASTSSPYLRSLRLHLSKSTEALRAFCDHYESRSLLLRILTTRLSNPCREEEPHLKVRIIISTGSGTQQAQTLYAQLLQPFLDSILFEAYETFLSTLSANQEQHGNEVSPALLASDPSDPFSTYLQNRHGLQFSIHKTTSPDSISNLTRSQILPSAEKGEQQFLLFFSGDGGVVDLVNGLLFHSSQREENINKQNFIKPTLWLFPSGTGNALAHSSGITNDKTQGLSSLFYGTPKPIPLMQIILPQGTYALDSEGEKVPNEPSDNDKEEAQIVHAAVVFSWALHSTLVSNSDKKSYRQHGASRFSMAAKDLLFPSDGSDPHAFKGTLSVQSYNKDDREEEDKHWEEIQDEEHAYLLITLVSNLEEKFRISPFSEPLDGVMRLLRFPPLQSQSESIITSDNISFSKGTPEGSKDMKDDKNPKSSQAGERTMRIMQLAYQNGSHISPHHNHYPHSSAPIKSSHNSSPTHPQPNEPQQNPSPPRSDAPEDETLKSQIQYTPLTGAKLTIHEQSEEWRRICIDGKIYVIPQGAEVQVWKSDVVVTELMVPGI